MEQNKSKKNVLLQELEKLKTEEQQKKMSSSMLTH